MNKQPEDQDPHQTPDHLGEDSAGIQDSVQPEKLDMNVLWGTYIYVRPGVEVDPDDPNRGVLRLESEGKRSVVPVKGPFSMRIWNPRRRPAPQAVMAGKHLFIAKSLESDMLGFVPQMGDGVMIELPNEELQRQLKSIKGGNRAAKIRRNQVRDKLARDGMLFLASDEESLQMLTDFCALMNAALDSSETTNNPQSL